MLEYDSKREIMQLERAATIVKNFDGHFVAYNTKFLGVSSNNDFSIKGHKVKNSRPINEICFEYDGQYHQLHLLNVYETDFGEKFASTELSMGIYAYWEITL